MPRKVRDLIKELGRAGFVDRGGKGSHRNFVHPDCPLTITISGRDGDDVKHYQEKELRQALQAMRRPHEAQKK